MDKINQTARGTGASVESEQETGYDIPLYHRPLITAQYNFLTHF